MTEAAFAYHEDVASRAIVKKSAAHKKNGSAVAKLGNKPMSWQEINKKHGPVHTYDLDSFMTFEEFKLLPPDLKVEYVNGLCKKWNIRICHVSEYLFKQGEKGLMGYLKIFDLYRQCTSSGEWTEESAEAFRKAVEAWENREEPAEVVDISEIQRKNDIINNAEFVTYEEFKSFNDDEKVAYLNNLFGKWQISYAAAEQYLFHTGRTTLSNLIGSRGLSEKIEGKFHGPKKQKLLNEAFDKAVKVWRGEDTVTLETETVAVAEVKPEEKPEEKPMEAAAEPVMVISVPDDMSIEILGDDIYDPNDFWHGNELFRDPMYDHEEEPEEEEPESEHVEEAADPLTYHDFSFTASYISKGLDTDEFYDLAKFVKNKLVKVEITVTEMRDYLSKVRT